MFDCQWMSEHQQMKVGEIVIQHWTVGRDGTLVVMMTAEECMALKYLVV